MAATTLDSCIHCDGRGKGFVQWHRVMRNASRMTRICSCTARVYDKV